MALRLVRNMLDTVALRLWQTSCNYKDNEDTGASSCDLSQPQRPQREAVTAILQMRTLRLRLKDLLVVPKPVNARKTQTQVCWEAERLGSSASLNCQAPGASNGTAGSCGYPGQTQQGASPPRAHLYPDVFSHQVQGLA